MNMACGNEESRMSSVNKTKQQEKAFRLGNSAQTQDISVKEMDCRAGVEGSATQMGRKTPENLLTYKVR
jgi:hypothetical protein